MYHIPILVFGDQDIATPPRTLPESDKRSYKLCQFIDTSRYLSLPHRGGSRGRVQGVRTPAPPEMSCGFLIQLIFYQKKKTMWFIGVEVEQSTPPPKKNPGSATASCGVFETFPALTLSRIFPCYFSKLHVIEEGKR